MDNGTSNSSSTEAELYFLIARFLSSGPCQRTAQVLLEELEEFKLLQKRVDWEGNQHFRTYENLVYLNRHIRGDHLLKVVERIGPLLDKDIKPSVPGVRSLLGAGSLSLLRKSEDLERPKWGLNHHLVTQNGAPHYPPHNLVPPNLALVMPAYQMTGVVRPHSAVPTVLYNKMSMYGRKLGHLDSVYCVLFDRTGNYIFTGADDTLVKIWSRHDLRLLATLRGHSAEITDMALSYENTYLASASLDKSVRVWCVRTKALCAVLHAHSSMITSVQFCPKVCGEHRYIVSTGNDGCVCFWVYNIETKVFNPKPIKFIEKSRAGAQMLCSSFSPGGAFLATGNSDHVVRVYFLHRIGPEKICELEAHNDKVDSICYANHHNSFISGSNDGTARIWKFDRQEWRATVLNMSANLNGSHGETGDERIRVTMVGWSMDDNRVVTAASDLTIKIWNSHTGTLVRVLEGHEDEVFVLETSPTDSRILVSASHDGKIIIWDIETGTKIKKFFNLIEGQGHGAVFDCKFSPDGQYLAATDSHGHLLMMGIGTNERCKKTPQQLFFHSDYRPLIRDSKGFVLDEQTQCPPHLMPPPFLVDIDGNPYPPAFQRLVPGRENAKASCLVPHIAVNEAGESEVVGDRDVPDQANDRDNQNNSDTDVDVEDSQQQSSSAAGRDGAVRASIDVMIEELQRQQDQRLGGSDQGSREAGPSGQLMSPPSLASPPATPRANAHGRVGMRRSGEIEGVRQSRASISVEPAVVPASSKETIGSGGNQRMTVKPMGDVDLRMSEEKRMAYSEEEITTFVNERKKKLISPSELTSASIANNKRRQKGKKTASNAQYLDDIPENVETARNRLTTRALYDTEEEEVEGGGSDSWQSDSSEDYSDWVGDQGSSNLEPPKRRSQRKRKRRYISSSEDEEEEEASSRELTVNVDAVEEAEAESTSDESTDDEGDDDKEKESRSTPNKRPRRKPKPAKPPPKQCPRSPRKKKKEAPIERNKEMDEKMKPPDWITTVIPRKAPFVPQMGDEVVYFRQGHELYLQAVKRKGVYEVDVDKNQPWHKIPKLRAHEFVKIVGIKWMIQPTRLCCLKLAFMDTESGKLTGKSFTIKYHDMPDVIDFIVLRQHYDISVQRGWKQGSKFRSMIDDQWWLGVIKSKEPMSNEFSDSLFQCFNVHWDNGEFEKLSPWDMEPIDNKRKPSVVGGGVDVTAVEYKAILYQPKKTEWPSCGREEESRRLVEGISLLMQHSFAEPFNTPVDLQQFPTYAYFVSYPIDLSTIKTRLENGFYRRITALQWDVRLIHTNAIIFNETGSKILLMADSVAETLLKFIKDQDCHDPLPLLSELAHYVTKGPSSGDETSTVTKKNNKGSDRRKKGSKKEVNPNQWLEQCESLLAMLFDCDDSSPFRVPVDPEVYTDYIDIVRNPMDLTTVLSKLEQGMYGNPLDLCKDIRLIFSNSKQYNTNKRSRIYSMTLRLSALFEDQISQIIKQWKSTVRLNRRIRRGTTPNHSTRPTPTSAWSSLMTESLFGSQPSTSGVAGSSSSSRDTASRSNHSHPATSKTENSSTRNAKSKARAISSDDEDDDDSGDDTDATIVDGVGSGVDKGKEDSGDETEICDDGDVAAMMMKGRGCRQQNSNHNDDGSEDDEENETDDADYKPSSRIAGGKTPAKGGRPPKGKGKSLNVPRGKGKSSNPLPLRPSSNRVKKSNIFYVSDGEDNLLEEEDDIIIPPILKFGKSRNGMVHSFEIEGKSEEEDINDLNIKDNHRLNSSRRSNKSNRGKRKARISLSPEVKKRSYRKPNTGRKRLKQSVLSDEDSEISPEKPADINSALNRSSRKARSNRKCYGENSDSDEVEEKIVKPVRRKVAKKYEESDNDDSDSEEEEEEEDGEETEDEENSDTEEEEPVSSPRNGYKSAKRGNASSNKRKVSKRKFSSSEDDEEEKTEEDSEDDDGPSHNHKKVRKISIPANKSAKVNNHSVGKGKIGRVNNFGKKRNGADSKVRTRNRGTQRVTYMEDSEDDNNGTDMRGSASGSSDTEIDDSPVSNARSVSSRGRLRKMTTRAKESLKAY